MACKYKLFGEVYTEDQIKSVVDDSTFRKAVGLPSIGQIKRENGEIVAVYNEDGTPSRSYAELANKDLPIEDFVEEAFSVGLIESLDSKEVALAYWMKANMGSVLYEESPVVELYSLSTANASTSTKVPATTRYLKITDTIESQIKRMQEQIARLNVTMRTTKDAAVLRKALDEKDALLEQIENKRRQIENLFANDYLATGAAAIEELLNEAEGIISNKKANITDAELDYVSRIIKLALKASDFSSGQHIFFSDADMQNTYDMSLYRDLGARASDLNRLLIGLQNDSIQKFVSTSLSTDTPLADIVGAITDASWWRTRTLGLNRMRDKLLSSIAVAMKKAHASATLEADQIAVKIDSLMAKALPKLTAIDSKEPFRIFMQQIKGLYTGNLVFRFSQEFFETRKAVWRNYGKLKRANEAGLPWDTEAKMLTAFNTAINWTKDNTIVFDVRKLFPTAKGATYQYKHQVFSNKDKDDHIAELKTILGDAGFDYYYAKLQDKIEHFYISYEAAVDRINADPTITDKATAIEYWDKKNSPYWYAKSHVDGQTVTVGGLLVDPRGGIKHTYTVARKNTLSTGAPTAWYDKNFSKIEADPDILNLYNFILDTLGDLNTVVPDYKKTRLQRNSIPFIARDMVEIFSGMGATGLTKELWSKLIESTRTEERGIIDFTERDALTNKPIQRTIFHSMDAEGRIDDLYKLKKTEWELANVGKTMSAAVARQLYLEAQDEIAIEKSWDLGKVLKAYAMYVLAYKQKTLVEDSINLAANVFREKEELETNVDNTAKVDKHGMPIKIAGLKNLNEILDYNIEVFYGKNRYLKEGKTTKKVLTPKEKALEKRLKKNIEDAEKLVKSNTITQEAADRIVAESEEALAKLGGVVTASSVGDMALKLTQLRAMGWNLFGGISNLGFGTIANFIEASDGRLFKQETMMRAYTLVLHSIKRNLSAHTLEDGTAIKIRTLMDKLDISKDASNELYKASKKSAISGKARFLEPMQINKRTEYVNQAPIMVSIMMETKVKDIIPDYDGDETVWEAFDNDGNFLGEADLTRLIDLKIKIDSAVAKVHGNYDFEMPVLGKQAWIGRALLMFRTWALEGFATRFESEGYDDILKQSRKGRYRSYATLFTDKDHGAFSNVTFTILQLLGKLVGKKTSFDDRFNEVDAANLRANLTELVILLGVMGTAAMLRFLKGDDDDEEKNKTAWTMMFLLNQLNRMQTDILFYTSVTEFEKLSQNALPVFDLVIDANRFRKAVVKAIGGEDTIDTGIYAGDSRLLLESLNLFPFGTQVRKLYVLTKQDLN